MKYLIRPIINHPFLTVILITAVTVFFAYNLKGLRVDNDVTTFLPDNHPVKVAQNNIKEEFGSAEMIMIGLVTDNVFKTDFLKKIKHISKKLKWLKIESDPFTDPETGEIKTKQKRCIEDVISLSTVKFIEGDEFGMIASDLMEEVPETEKDMAALKERVFSWDFYVDNLVSSDSKATAVGIEFKSTLSAEEQIRMVQAIRAAVAETGFSDDVDVYIAGEPFVSSMISLKIRDDINLLLPLVFAVVIIFLYVAMRRVSYVILIFITIAFSVVWTMGMMAVLGYAVGLISSSIPILLVAVGSAYSIHIINHYSDERAEGKDAVTAVENSVNIVGVSVFAAAMTTMAGFMSLMTSSIVPIKEFGLFTGVGTGVAFIVSVIFVPALLLILDRIFKKKDGESGAQGKPGIDLVPALHRTFEKLAVRSKAVFAAALLIAAIAVFFTFRIYADMNPVYNFKKDSEIRKADAMLCERFSGTNTIVIALESDEDGYFKHPEALRKIEAFSAFMEKDPVVGIVVSLVEPIKRMNVAMNENKEEFNVIPPTREHVAQYLFLNSDPEALEGVVTDDYRKIRMVILIKDGSVVTLERINEKIRGWLDNNLAGLKIELAGTAQIGVAINDMVITGQIKSLIFSIITVFFIASIVLRSLTAGLLAIIPLSISVLLNFGILGAFGIPLDVGTAIIAGIAIGIGVDYSIHLLNGVRHGLITKGPDQACHEGIKITGNAITFNAVSVAFGFLVLVCSSFVPLNKLGSFIAFTMATASLGTMLLLPVLIKVINPEVLRKQRK